MTESLRCSICKYFREKTVWCDKFNIKTEEDLNCEKLIEKLNKIKR